MTDGSSAALHLMERRKEPRVAITKNALIRANGGMVVKGQVIDVSSSGLRIRYSGKGLEAGSEVDVIYPLVGPKATVAWTSRSGQWVETGLAVTAEDSGCTDLVQLLSIAV